MRRLNKVIENEGWMFRPLMQDGQHLAEFVIITPAGEDFCPTIWYGNGSPLKLIEGLDEYIENFDVDQETYLWLGHDGHGVNGAPYHIKDILEDKEWSLNKMKSLSKKLKNTYTI